MIFETFVRNSWGEFTSAGCADTDPAEMVKFFATDDGTEPRYRIGEITRSGELVRVSREIRVSGVEVERNDCLFPTEGEAELFESQIRALIQSEAA